MKKKTLTEERAKIVSEHIALARQVANRHRQFEQSDRLPMEDLEGEAYMGLVEAAINWDSRLGPFIPFAKKVIKSHLIQADRGHKLPFNLPWSAHQILRDIRRAVNEGTPENPVDISKALKINVNKIKELWKYYLLQNKGNAWVDIDGENPYLADSLIAEGADIFEEVSSDLDKANVARAIETLPPASRKLIRYRFGFETGTPMLSNEVMAVMGLGRADYEALEVAALERLEAYLRGYPGVSEDSGRILDGFPHQSKMTPIDINVPGKRPGQKRK